MTLVVVGHEFEPSGSYSWGGVSKEPAKMKQAGLFVVADSAITSPATGQTLLGGFQKVYPIAVKLWQPYFVGLYFHSYQTVYYETECFVAIAGSTLTAQHILNAIAEHLSSLRITFIQNEKWGEKGSYKIVMKCEENPLFKNAGTDEWSEDLFVPEHYGELLTAREISRVVGHAVNAALGSAKQYRLDMKSLQAMTTDIALGLTCPVGGTDHLFICRMKSEIDAVSVNVFAEMREIQPTEVAVLGMRKFEARAQKVFDDAILAKVSPSKKMFAFLNEAIDEVSANNSFEIDRPSYLKMFYTQRLKNVARRDKE